MPEIRDSERESTPDLPTPTAKWFAIYTATHHEKRVQEQFLERGIESFLPMYTAHRHWKKRTPITLQLPLFPNYVFVRIAQGKRSTVLSTPGVFSIIGSARNGWELPELEIQALQRGVCCRNVEPHTYLAVGDRARVKSGVLAGLEGVVIRKKNNLQIILTLDQIMRSVAIEVHADELEAISRRSHQPLGAPGLNLPPEHQYLTAHGQARC